MKRFALALAACIVVLLTWAGDVTFTEARYAGDDSGPAVGPTQYRDPVIAGFYPDPSAVSIFQHRLVPMWWYIGGLIDHITGDQKDLLKDQPDRQCSK